MGIERRPTEELERELRLSPWEAVVIRASNVVLATVGRIVDLAVLLLRPWLLRPYFGLWWAELLRSPYRGPRSFEAVRVVKASGQTLRELMYGEGLTASAIWLFRRAGVDRRSRVLDIGAGRGRVLLGARWLGAEAAGIELREEHVRAVRRSMERAGARLETGDAMKADLGQPTHVFLNWCAFSPETKARVVERLGGLAPGTRIIAVTQPIEDPKFKTLSRHRVLFTWGTEPAWIHERVEGV